MKKYIDLHIHSTNSDGSWTPSRIVERALKYELSVISITDHDTVSGIPEALEAVRGKNLDFVPGIEISTKWCHGRMHILGYFIDHNSPSLKGLSTKLGDARKERVLETCRRLAEIGKPISPELVMKMAGDSSSPGRPHIANAMVKMGYVPTLQKAFDLYLSYGKPGYVPRWSPEPEEAIDIIHSAGGIAVIAHCPVTEGCMEQIDNIIELGIDGIEAYYPSHKPHEIKKLIDIAKSHNLAITGGSDCHGMTRGEPLLGIYKVPYEVYENLVVFYENFKLKDKL
ncbi:phosphatase [bacterium]|nr:MAG: phosphatase [bacterium]